VSDWSIWSKARSGSHPTNGDRWLTVKHRNKTNMLFLVVE
jgi:hypothetical protein